MVNFYDILRAVFSASCMAYISELHSKFAPRPHHVWKYGRHPICDRDRKKKKERKKKETTAVKYNGLTYTRAAIIKPVGYKMRNTGMHRVTRSCPSR